MLTKSDKEAIVGDLKTSIEKAKAVYLTNLIGVQSNDAVRVRKSLREVKGKVVVTRNTLFEIASKGTKCETLLSGLKGTNAVAFAFDDVATVAKCLYEAGKNLKQVELRSGILGDKILSGAELKQLATLPARDQMLATLLATFNAPVSAFVRVLDAIREKAENN